MSKVITFHIKLLDNGMFFVDLILSIHSTEESVEDETKWRFSCAGKTEVKPAAGEN